MKKNVLLTLCYVWYSYKLKKETNNKIRKVWDFRKRTRFCGHSNLLQARIKKNCLKI